MWTTRNTAAAYVAALRDEPKMRAYLVATLLDAVGIAASIWAAQLIMAQVFVDQRTRASLVIPTLLSSLAGTIVAGPLADWQGRRGGLRTLAVWRWQLVIVARVFETVALATLVPALARGAPTVAGLLPYFMISSFLKMALGSTRVALEVDLLRAEQVQTNDDGSVRLDERGEPLVYKVNLLTLTSLLAAVNGLAAMGGLLLGNRIIALTGGRYWPLFAFDVATNSAFVVVLFVFCHPTASRPSLRAFFTRAERRGPASGVAETARELVESFREVFRFLFAEGQRVLLWVLVAAWLIELFGEFYDDKMILKQLLGASNSELWRAEIVWSVAAVLPSLVLPALSRRVGRLGRLLVVALVVDGVVIATAGHLSSIPTSLVPFSAALALDRGLTVSSKTLVALVQNSASSAAIRGRLAAVFGILVLASNVVVQSVATVAAEAVGIPRMVMLVGVAQITLVGAVALAGGGRLWRFGLHPRNPRSVAPPALDAAE